MALTEQWLRQQTNAQSYERGEDIAASQDIEIEKTGTTYTANVWGDKKYKVVIQDLAPAPRCACTCPYAFDGLCKHIVAVCLGILDGGFEETADTGFVKPSDRDARVADHPDFFKKIFKKADKDQRTAFLRQLFDKNRDLRLQFVQFLRADDAPTPSIKPDIAKISEKVHGALDKIEFDSDDYYRQANGEDDEDGSEMERWMSEKIKKILLPYFQQAKNHLTAGRLPDCTAVLLGIYEGLAGLEAPECDDYYGDFLDDYDSSLETIFADLLDEISTALRATIAAEPGLLASQRLFFSRLDFYGKNAAAVFYLKTWESYLLALFTTEAAAKNLFGLLKKHDLVKDPGLAYVTLALADVLHDEKQWLATAEFNAPTDLEIAKMLLSRYAGAGRTADFYRVARRVFEVFALASSEFLLEKMVPKDDPAFYAQVLEQHTLAYRSHAHYLELRELLNPAERVAFAKKVKGNWDRKFYVSILETEGRFKDILAFVRENDSDRDLAFLIKPIVPHYPEECLLLVAQHAERLLSDSRRNRSTYRQIALELAALLASPQIKTQAHVFARQLVGANIRLTALKDELRQQGLM